MNRRRCGAGLLATVCVAAAWAQTDITTLKSKSEALTNSERTAIAQWVRTQAQKIAGDDAAERKDALHELHMSLRDATPAFLQALKPAASQEIGNAIAAAPPIAAMQLTAVLGDLGDATALPALVAALKSPDAGVRAAAAGSLLRLQQALVEAGAPAVTTAVQALEQAGTTEKNPSVLMAIYRALDYTRAKNPPNLDAIATSVLNIIKARGQRAQQGALAGLGADGVGLEVFTKLRPNETQADKQALLGALAFMMKQAAERYTTDASLRDPQGPSLVQVRDQIEHFLLQSELKLIELAPGGAPTKTMQTAFKDGGAVADVKDAQNAWAGRLQGQVPGNLVLED